MSDACRDEAKHGFHYTTCNIEIKLYVIIGILVDVQRCKYVIKEIKDIFFEMFSLFFGNSDSSVAVFL